MSTGRIIIADTAHRHADCGCWSVRKRSKNGFRSREGGRRDEIKRAVGGLPAENTAAWSSRLKVLQCERIRELGLNIQHTAAFLHRVEEVVGEEDARVGVVGPEKEAGAVVRGQRNRPFPGCGEGDEAREHGADVGDASAAGKQICGPGEGDVGNCCAGGGQMVEEGDLSSLSYRTCERVNKIKVW